MSTRAIFFQSLAGSNVDPINGIIRGVAVITGGITAKGHELGVDSITVAQLKECADKMGTVPVKWNHRTGADAVAGFLTNFFIEGNKLVGDWHLLHSHAQYNQAIEMATRMPQNVGLSAAFMGEDEEVGGKTYARCSELISVDLVANPAANPSGLFERRDDGVRLLGRARDADGQFADQTSAGANPASMAAAYSGAAVQRRDATHKMNRVL